MRGKAVLLATLFVAICELAGLLGSAFTVSSIPTWYAALTKPWFTPPNWLFAPVWIALYALMGLSAYLVWGSGSRKKGVRVALYAFAAQLALNVLWSAVFFGLHSPLLGMVIIVLLWVAVTYTILLFYKVSRKAAYAMLPYIAWVTVAAALNLAIFLLN